ncbi:MAG: SDR family oxidoreductase [Polyangiaceae bacterium]|nr:SDR family oxidoreductase [Polyangiaceae bacterium]
MSLYQLVKADGPSGFGYGSTAEMVTEGLSLAGKTILVTGCNSGLGMETLRVLALRGARVVGTARTVEKAREACRAVSGETTPVACELSDPDSVRSCVDAMVGQRIRLDAIICNAGIMALPKRELAHGHERQFFTNHIGHFLLVTGLVDQLTPAGRVVMVSSAAHFRAPRGGIEFDNLDGSKNYESWRAYGQSKFANILFAKELARLFRGTQRTANAVHPGVIHTNLGRHLSPFFRAILGAASPLLLKSVAQGAATQVYVATHPAVAAVSGKYFADCNVTSPRADAEDEVTATKLWELSERIASSVARPAAAVALS